MPPMRLLLSAVALRKKPALSIIFIAMTTKDRGGTTHVDKMLKGALWSDLLPIAAVGSEEDTSLAKATGDEDDMSKGRPTEDW